MFEWDEEKRRHNIEQHGVDFYDAILIFENPVVEAEDTRREYRETHIQAGPAHMTQDIYGKKFFPTPLNQCHGLSKT